MKNLSGKAAFVTGAASGIGLGISRSLVDAGVRVMMCDLDSEALGQAVEELRSKGGEVDSVRADVSAKPDLEAAKEAFIQRFGDLHILVNNAGVGGGGKYGGWSDKTWEWMTGVNLMGVVWGLELFTPLIEAHGQDGHIVCTASMAGLIPSVSSAYAATKYAVVGLCEGLRGELAPRGIGLSLLCPSLVATRIADAERNRPERFIPEGPRRKVSPEGLAMMQAMIASGTDPDYVGVLVRKGIEENWPYIFTDLNYEAALEARFKAMKEGFDRIRSFKDTGSAI